MTTPHQPEEPLLRDEQWEVLSRYVPETQGSFFAPQNMARDFLANPGRFKSPLSFGEKLQLKLFSSSSQLDFFMLSRYFFNSSKMSIPPAWQVLLRYLQKEGLIDKAEIRTSLLLNDIPKSFFFEIVSKLPGGILGKEYSKRVISWGNSSSDEETALSKAVGELLERFFLSCWPNKKIFSVEQLKKMQKKFLHPAELSHFTPEQKSTFPRFEFRENQAIAWIEGRDLFGREKILLPAQSVFRGYDFDENEPVLRDPNSNGCAGHFTLTEAVLAGIYENVERDGFLIYWLNSLAPPIIDLMSLQNKELLKLVEKLERYQFEVRFLNTTTDINIPSFICVLIDRSEKGPRVAIGGGAGFDPEKVLLEIGYKTLISYQSMQDSSDVVSLPKDYTPFTNRNLRKKDRVLLWQNPAMFSTIEPFLSGKKQTLQDAFPSLPVFSHVQEEFSYVTDIFRALGEGYKIYFYEAKHPVLEKIGYRVVKVIIPELIHLYLNEAFPPLGALRLKKVPEKMGKKSAEKWNPWPHPFP